MLAACSVALPLAAQGDAESCGTCHPAALKGLAQSAHGTLLATPPAAGACVSCHLDTGPLGEARSAAAIAHLRAPEPVPPRSCQSCHVQAFVDTVGAAHPFRRLVRGAQDPPPSVPAPEPSHELPAARRDGLRLGGFDIDAALALGVRLVKVTGDERRYDEDFNLDQGVRLLEASVSARGVRGEGWLDAFRFAARDVDDPYQVYEGEVSREKLYRLRGGYRRTNYTYDPGGDYHSYDIVRANSHADLDIDLGESVRWFSHFDLIERSGVVTTSRIGNQNVTPFVPVAGVSGPRRLASATTETGLAIDAGRTQLTAAARWLEEAARDRRSYARSSPLNPAFPESEDTTTDWSLRGPGTRVTLRTDPFDDGRWEFSTSWDHRKLERRTLTRGTSRGFDIGEFQTETYGLANGRAETLIGDVDLVWHALDRVSVLLDLRRLYHKETQDLRLEDITTYPGLGSTVVVDGSRQLGTRQEVLEGSAALEVRPLDALTLTAGYGYATEKLRLPDLEAGDNDFVAGRIRSQGLLAAVLWKPHEWWTAQLDYREFGQDDTQLNPTSPEMGRRVEGKLRLGPHHTFVEVFAHHRHTENDLSRTSVDATTVGLTAVAALGEACSLHASQTETWIDSATLTNFYYAPDPTPYPTRVGFDGITHATAGGIELRPCRSLRWNTEVSFVRTNGDFDVRFFHLLSDVALELCDNASLGFQARVAHYREDLAQAPSDYDALVGMVYLRTTF